MAGGAIGHAGGAGHAGHMPEIAPRQSAGDFDYSVIAPDIATDLRDRATRIRTRMRRSTEDMLDTGRDLLAAKERVKHGEFTLWVESELGITVRSAQTMMRAAEMAAESENFSLLPPSVALRLSAPSVPDEIRISLVERAANGEHLAIASVTAELRRIKDEEEKAKLKAQKEAELARLSPRARKSREERERQLTEQHNAYREKREAEQHHARQRADELAQILHARLLPEEWRRVRELLGDFDVVRPQYLSGIEEFHTTKAMDALGVPPARDSCQPAT